MYGPLIGDKTVALPKSGSWSRLEIMLIYLVNLGKLDPTFCYQESGYLKPFTDHEGYNYYGRNGLVRVIVNCKCW